MLRLHCADLYTAALLQRAPPPMAHLTPMQLLCATTLFALSTSATCALLQFPLAHASLNALMSFAYGGASGHEDVLWQGDLHGAYSYPRTPP